mmetsp:Transcript_63648/g.175606  ORF Transcript_63648/g.175606 Transcript_63648/m.175606 type:complete len:532 (+) Transcript_63648:687-2282(+)
MPCHRRTAISSWMRRRSKRVSPSHHSHLAAAQPSATSHVQHTAAYTLATRPPYPRQPADIRHVARLGVHQHGQGWLPQLCGQGGRARPLPAHGPPCEWRFRRHGHSRGIRGHADHERDRVGAQAGNIRMHARRTPKVILIRELTAYTPSPLISQREPAPPPPPRPHRVTNAKRFAKHQEALGEEFKQLTRKPQKGKWEVQRDVRKLGQLWGMNNATLLREEKERLAMARRPAEYGQWDSSSVTSAPSTGGSVVSRTSEASSFNRRTRPRPGSVSGGLGVGSGSFDLLSSQTDGGDSIGARSQRSRSSIGRASMGRGARGSRASSRSGSADDTASVQDLEQREAERTLAQAQARVVSAVIEYDGYLDEIKRITKSTIQAYRAARLHSQRQDSFDQLTAMLGPYLPARGGFTDWRGRDVKGMQSVTVRLVEAVVAWRKARMAAGLKPVTEGLPDPFIWNNVNVLARIPSALDFLGKIEELRHWYGTEYQFQGNPFSRACTLEERPVTPPSAMVTVILDDVPVEQVNQRLLEKR